jgi:hypothetical protein
MTITAKLFDGTVLQFPDGTDPAIISRVAKEQTAAKKAAMAAKPTSAMEDFEGQIPPRADAPKDEIPKNAENSAAGLVGQFGAGSQSGIANTLGFPVDALTGAMNFAGNATGLWSPIEDPILGSGTFNRLLKPFNKAIPEPQTTAERYARRIGEDAGATAVMAPVGMSTAIAKEVLPQFLAAQGSSSLGSSIAGQSAREIAPDSAMADIVASLVGGAGAGLGAFKALGADDAVMRSGIDEQKAIASDAYGAVRADKRVLPQDSVDDMALGLSAKMDAERLNPRLQPGSAAILDAVLQDSSGPMRIEDIENLRRMTSQNMPVTATQADRRLSGMMTDEITNYLDSLGDETADMLKEGRTAYRRASAASAVQGATDKATRRASRTGAGGNEINAIRQNLSAIIENPRKARSFTADELAMMDEVVRGTTGQNAMRGLSRFAPTSGGLSAMLGIGGAMASPAIALPIMGVTEAAKALGERSTRKSIADLLQSLAPDRVLKPSDPGLKKTIAAMLAARTMAGGE